MVRFIIEMNFTINIKTGGIYIPIWLDLLYFVLLINMLLLDYLHSNMVRFIMEREKSINAVLSQFTFQYG